MDVDQKKSYHSKEWSYLRDRVIERDGHRCVRCKRTDYEVELQVHHIHYVKGKMAWDYQLAELETLCKGCHAQEHGHIMPLSGWEYQGENDLGDLLGVCEYCGSELRYEHSIYHPNWGYLIVGASCADKLTESHIGSLHEEERKKYARRLRTYLDSPKWKHIKNGYFFILKQYKIVIWENSHSFQLEIHYPVISDLGYTTLKRLRGKEYSKIEDAKAKAFEAIESGSLKRYLIKHHLTETNGTTYYQV